MLALFTQDIADYAGCSPAAAKEEWPALKAQSVFTVFDLFWNRKDLGQLQGINLPEL